MRRSTQGFGKWGEDDSDEVEDGKSDANSNALVAFDEVGERKKNRALLKAKAKAITSKDPNKVGKIIFDVDGDGEAPGHDDGTFVTGVGIPGKKKGKKNYTAEELKHYEFPEDELMDRVDQTEKEMH